MNEPLVFLPGMMCDARVFGPQLAALSPHYTLTVAPITGGDRIEEIASRLLDNLPRKFALAGLSMGGCVAMEILRRAPDRLTRIALMDTNALAETPQSAANYEPMIIKVRSGRLAEAVPDFLPPDNISSTYRNEIMALVQDMAENLGADTVIRQARALQRRRDQQPALRRCKIPALVLCGSEDRLTPVKRHRFMAELIPYAELKVIDGAGHLPTLEQPDATTQAILDWMKQPFVLQTPAITG
ncbi:alpha/beta fold hydrolase [Roseovarius faecimaris]|uniref:Alpha/beta fold hydrolase n=1 Tax=Roseovarius faecimaris TaxID=2494550 RepID=A0A6I6IRG1_9RHOB|nr:alpha/beta fold hydrolase [Roseovarius faecimaris]QGX97846.1 alpha/beta fold hydrolase [Roseovarius faecimaris]